MILSNIDVERLLRDGIINITPRPGKEQIGPGSVDLTLSDEFWRFKKSVRGKTLDLEKMDLEKVTEKVVADKIILRPGELILGKTVERIRLPRNICGVLEGRSRYARKGLAIHVTSSFIQPGSDNRQVLEITNLAPYSLMLRAGMRVSQVVFEELRTPTSRPYNKFGKIARKQ